MTEIQRSVDILTQLATHSRNSGFRDNIISKNVVICGMPDKPEIDDKAALKSLLLECGFELGSGDVISCRRLGVISAGPTPSSRKLLVRLRSDEQANELLKMSGRGRGLVTSSGGRVYVNRDLMADERRGAFGWRQKQRSVQQQTLN